MLDSPAQSLWMNIKSALQGRMEYAKDDEPFGFRPKQCVQQEDVKENSGYWCTSYILDTYSSKRLGSGVRQNTVFNKIDILSQGPPLWNLGSWILKSCLWRCKKRNWLYTLSMQRFLFSSSMAKLASRQLIYPVWFSISWQCGESRLIFWGWGYIDSRVHFWFHCWNGRFRSNNIKRFRHTMKNGDASQVEEDAAWAVELQRAQWRFCYMTGGHTRKMLLVVVS